MNLRSKAEESALSRKKAQATIFGVFVVAAAAGAFGWNIFRPDLIGASIGIFMVAGALSMVAVLFTVVRGFRRSRKSPRPLD